VAFDDKVLRTVYDYDFELTAIQEDEAILPFEGSTILISEKETVFNVDLENNIDFYISVHAQIGSVLLINGSKNEKYVADIQHVRRRETIAMTPANCLIGLKLLVGTSRLDNQKFKEAENKASVLKTINDITGTTTKALVGSSGLSIQYAILMGLIDNALENHIGKAIKIVVPPNCYGGTNDQARRVAACRDNVDIVDLPVDGGNDMVNSIDTVLNQLAKEDAIPYIIAEIPTNPRVEVPDLEKLRDTLSQVRHTPDGSVAIDPVFILDQTFCPNVHFLGEGDMLAGVRTISFASGSKFPSGGLCTAGYCVGNIKAQNLIEKIEKHLILCDNEATDLQMAILAEQMPSMIERIAGAYKNTREFVNYIKSVLPAAKINFVSEELATQGFTPSVFSLDLPTKGKTEEEREAYKRQLNHQLINLMFTEIPDESKYCVSYGQLKGCYWTIPATSTQGTTKEGDKDYIARVALSPDMDLAKHKAIFKQFVNSI
ncbi:MAG: cystathionine beta-synthase, partial [Putridiphycobacter sp.]|nr:cystathionine beta-synthase [Putridiphycobacter sp.]